MLYVFGQMPSLMTLPDDSGLTVTTLGLIYSTMLWPSATQCHPCRSQFCTYLTTCLPWWQWTHSLHTRIYIFYDAVTKCYTVSPLAVPVTSYRLPRNIALLCSVAPPLFSTFCWPPNNHQGRRDGQEVISNLDSKYGTATLLFVQLQTQFWSHTQTCKYHRDGACLALTSISHATVLNKDQ